LVKGGEAIPYSGSRDVATFKAWLEEKTGAPATEEPNAEEL
jgi:hypothetical protein